MTTESNPPRSLGAVMSSEASYEAEVDDSPLRISGFIALILALLSGFTVVALPMVGFAIAGVLFALFALRKTDPATGSAAVPVGTTAARVAILMAVLFASWGVGRYAFKQNTLGSQAEYFARQFMRVAGSGNEIYAKELQKSYVNRFLKTMPLEKSYELQRLKREEERKKAEEEGYNTGYGTDDVDNTLPELMKYGVDHEWVLYRPVRVYNHYGRQMAQVILASDHSDKSYKLMLILEYLVHKEKGTSEWYVQTCQPYHERIVAESVL